MEFDREEPKSSNSLVVRADLESIAGTYLRLQPSSDELNPTKLAAKRILGDLARTPQNDSPYPVDTGLLLEMGSVIQDDITQTHFEQLTAAIKVAETEQDEVIPEVPYLAIAGLISRYRAHVTSESFGNYIKPHHENIARWYESRLEVHSTQQPPMQNVPVKPLHKIIQIIQTSQEQ